MQLHTGKKTINKWKIKKRRRRKEKSVLSGKTKTVKWTFFFFFGHCLVCLSYFSEYTVCMVVLMQTRGKGWGKNQRERERESVWVLMVEVNGSLTLKQWTDKQGQKFCYGRHQLLLIDVKTVKWQRNVDHFLGGREVWYMVMEWRAGTRWLCGLPAGRIG